MSAESSGNDCPGKSSAEFDLINRFFRRARDGMAPGVVLGVGDDCALLAPTPGMQLAVSTDTLVEGVHFPADTPAADVGWKALAVNLSDLAAMGATPRGCLLALTLPAIDEAWVAAFAQGFFTLADAAGCPLLGGDTTCSTPRSATRPPAAAAAVATLPCAPCTMTVTVLGEIPAGAALRRDGARPGDLVCVSGTLGDAALGLARWQQMNRDRQDPAIVRLLRPTPRLALGSALRGVATAAIDLSDGLLGDLQHILAESSRASGKACGVELQLAALPRSAALAGIFGPEAYEYMLAGGDDYELCFTVPASRLTALHVAAASAQVPVAVIGRITDDGRLRCLAADGGEWQPSRASWEHFSP